MVFCFYLFLLLSVQNVTGTSGTFRIKFQKTWFFHQLRVEINRQIVISCEFNINRLKTHLFLYCCHVQARWQILPIHHRSGIEEDLTSSKTCQRQQIKNTFISLTPRYRSQKLSKWVSDIPVYNGIFSRTPTSNFVSFQSG